MVAPKYSEFLKEMAKKEPAFCSNVHDKLTELVKLAKESKQKSRAHSFEYMNRYVKLLVQTLATRWQ